MLWMVGSALAQVPNSVLWYHGHGGTTLDNQDFVDHVENELLGLVTQQSEFDQVVLGDHRVLILARPTLPLVCG